MHRTDGIACLFLVALACFAGVLICVSCFGDTILLKNGYSIDGMEVVERGENEKFDVPEGKIRINFSNGGWMLIDKKDVESVERNNKDVFKKEGNE